MRLPPSIDTVEMAKAAMDRGVAFVPGPPFYADGSGRDALRLAYSWETPERNYEGAKLLAQATNDAR